MTSPTFKLIRGARIIQQMQLDETTFTDLENRTRNFQPPASPTARQNATGPIQIQKVQLIPSRQSGVLDIKVMVNSSGKKYQPSIHFDKVVFDDSDQSDNTTFKGIDNKEYHMVPIQLNQSNVKVHCDCLDFHYRFAQHNNRDGSLLGNPPPPYQRRTLTHAPVNPQKTPGLCKHLMKAIVALRGVDIVR